jgi:thiamine biosynthesis lipoprotein
MLTRTLDGAALPPAAPAGALNRQVFPSMGIDIALIGPSPMTLGEQEAFGAAAQAVEGVFGWVDARFSRFRDDSELSTLNRRAGRWQRVSPMFAEVLRLALTGARATEGLFDPTILPELVAAGYDRDYDELAAGTPHVGRPPRRPVRWHDVQLDGVLLYLPPGCALDFGGVAKGWAVDLAVGASAELPWAVVDAGGDLRVVGRPPQPVPIGVADPHDPSTEILQLGLESGALATSSTVGRTWGNGLHHVIDPRTSLPARTGVVQATVWADTCTDAEILSKWALLSGPRVLPELPAVLVMEDGRVLVGFQGVKEPVAC